LYRSNAEKEHAGDKLELQAKGQSKDKLELRVSPNRERDLDSGRNAPLFDRLEQKNAKIASAPMPAITADNQISDEVAQLKKDLPTEKIAEIAAGPPSSATDTKVLSRQRGTRNDDSLAYLAKSADTATVTADAVPAQTTEISVSKAKAARKPATSNETSAVGAVAPAGARAANEAVALQTTSLLAAANSRWTISPEGKLQSSTDNGTTWQNVSLPSDSALLALATVGRHVWVGGRSGTLFHSSDSGQHWIQLKPSLDGQTLTADIIGLEFTDVLHGKLITKDQTCLTSDGGQSWHKQ
jgi:hypothetical protein